MRLRCGIAAVSLVAATMMVAGCAQQPPIEDPATVQLQIRHELDARWSSFSATGRRPIAIDYHFILPGGIGFAIVNCMNNAGYDDYTVNRSSSLYDVNARADPSGVEALAYYDCYHEFIGYDPSFDVPAPATRAVLYNYYSRQLVPCLEAAGFTIDSLPTESQFDQPVVGQPGGWNPYLEIEPPATGFVAGMLLERCPAYPR